MKKLYSTEGLAEQFMILVCLQPIVDIYRIFVGNAIEIAGISLVELINILFIGYLLFLFMLNQKRVRSFIPAIIYAIVLCLYLVLHCYNVLQFDTTIITGTDINIVIELYVIIRAYILPVMLLYIMVYIRTTEERFLKTTVYTSYFISIVIVVTNLLKVSFVSYASSLETNEFIRQNFIEWFTKQPPENLNLITSKGWFYSGNQIGLILLMLFPIVVYYAIQRQKTYTYVMVAVQVMAMILVATKTAALGAFLVLGVMAVLLIVFCLIEKEWKKCFKTLGILALIFVGGLFFLMKSPVIRMMGLQSLSYEESEVEEALEGQTAQLLPKEKDEEFDREGFIKFINRYYYVYGIQEEYIKLLPVEQYTDFWFSVFIDESKRQVDFRDFKQRLYQLVLSENNNMGDEYWGIGYTTNFPYLEKDIYAQSVWFGNVGCVLFVGPYFICFLYAVINILLNLRKKINIYVCTLGLSICAGTMGALLAGHLFGYFFPIIIYSYVIAQLKHATADSKRVNKKLKI